MTAVYYCCMSAMNKRIVAVAEIYQIWEFLKLRKPRNVLGVRNCLFQLCGKSLMNGGIFKDLVCCHCQGITNSIGRCCNKGERLFFEPPLRDGAKFGIVLIPHYLM